MELVRTADAEEAARVAAERIAAAIQGGAVHVALAGGSTPMRCYELLGPLVGDWTGMHLWYGDERCVAPDHEDANHRAARAHLKAPGAEWHRMPGELGPDAGAERYAAELDGTVLDLTLLGMGPDGHTASLFPGHPVLDAEGVAAGVHDSPKPPPERITLTLLTFNASKQILLLATGAEKAPALARVLDGPPDRATPVSLLDRDRLVVVADAAALAP